MEYCLHKITRLVPVGCEQQGNLWDTLVSCLAPEHFAGWFPDLLWKTRIVSQQPFLAAAAMTRVLHVFHCLPRRHSCHHPSSLG